jgi:uncharacterized repeat protein (TIGR03806 family)
VISALSGLPVPDMVVGGWVDPAKVPGVYDPTLVPVSQQVAGPLRVCFANNGAATFFDMNGLDFSHVTDPAPLFDVSTHACAHPPIAAVVLPPTPPPPVAGPELTPEETRALCNAPGEGVNWDAFVANCETLSRYRLFPGDPRQQPADGGIPYDLTMPLFSDYAAKHRVLFVPPGQQMVYSPDQVFDLPVGTIIAKTFSFRNESVEPAVDTLVETRLLIHREEGWVGLPYIWRADRSDAVLEVNGGFRTVTLTTPRGEVRTTDYEIPSRADCGGCHFGSHGDVPIGPKARLLNRSHEYHGRIENQLAHLSHAGVLAYGPARSDDAPRLPMFSNPADGTLEERAKAYLESNCAHCHNPSGRAGFTGLWLEHDSPVDIGYGVCKRPVAAGSGALGSWVLVPGDPADSILVNRMKSVAPAIKMPELAKSLAHDEGVALVEAWIATLAGSCP